MVSKAKNKRALPEGWREVALGEICKVITSPVDKKTVDGEFSVKLCNYKDVYYNNTIDSTINFMSATAKAQEIEKFSIIKDDVIITKDSETPDDIGVPAYVKETMSNLLCGYHLTILRPQKNVAGKYVCYALMSSRAKYNFYRYANGITRFGLTAESYQKIKIFVPPLPEQKSIASLLGKWDTAIEKTEALIAAKEKQFQWLLKTLISDQQDNPEWREVELGGIGDTFSGLSGKSKKDFGKGKFFITYLNIYQNISISSSQLGLCLVATNEKQNAVIKGDVLFTTSSETPDEVGISSILLHDIGECYLNSFCFGWRRNKYGNEILQDNYLKYFLRSTVFRKQVRKLAQGATRYNLSKRQLMKSWIFYPDIKEQDRISNMLDASRHGIDLLTQLAEQYRAQKRGLMQKLLAGEWRVNIGNHQTSENIQK